jgi:putative endonuclease
MKATGTGSKKSARRACWIVYVLVSSSARSTYVGITCDLRRRLAQHNGELAGGAKFTRGRRPWSIAVEFGPYGGRGQAARVEHEIKRLRGDERLLYCATPALDTMPRSRRGGSSRRAKR